MNSTIEETATFEINGTLIKNSFDLPKGVSISWINWLEGGKRWRKGFWRLVTPGTSTLTDSNFQLKTSISEDYFYQNFTTDPEIMQRLRGKLTDFKLAMGFIHGYFDEESKNMHFYDLFEGHRTNLGELAWADMYLVFYKNGTFDLDTLPPCHWINQLPQGFSCGRAARADSSCRGSFFDR